MKRLKQMVVGGMRTFLFIWFGQMISLIGSGLTSFGLGVWVYERTGSATEFALIAVFMLMAVVPEDVSAFQSVPSVKVT